MLPVAIEASIHGAVEDGKLRLRYKSPFGDGELEPVPVANRGSVLNTMAPLNRLRGLAPGRRWQIALIDPMSAIPILSRANPKPRILNAEVKEETIEWPAGPGDANPLEVPCYVIYYRGEDDTRARTWVRQSDEMVLQQEASFGDLQLTLRRDLER